MKSLDKLKLYLLIATAKYYLFSCRVYFVAINCLKLYTQGDIMNKAVLTLALVFLSLGFLWAGSFEWGIKYGIGSSSIHGNDKDYELAYDIFQDEAGTTDLGYLRVRSNKSKAGFSQNAGIYASARIFKKIDSIKLNSEIIWHRYNFISEYENSPIQTNNVILAQSFGDSLSGNIQTTADYISLPVFISFNQELSEEAKQKQYQGAFIYGGPSFSLLLGNESKKEGGISAMDYQVKKIVMDSFSDADPLSNYSYKSQVSGFDELIQFKTDIVFGVGFGLKDLFKFGFGKDEFNFDLRFTMGLNELGDTGKRDAVTLRSIMFSIGSKL